MLAGHWTAAAAIYSDIARAAPTLAAAHAGWARALVYGNKSGADAASSGHGAIVQPSGGSPIASRPGDGSTQAIKRREGRGARRLAGA